MRFPIVRHVIRPRPRPDRLFGPSAPIGPEFEHPIHPRPGFECSLRDGRYVFLAPVLPEDRHRLEAAFDLLSDRSRHFRFFRRSDRLSEAELREFTEVDQVDHVAWCALDAPDPPFDGLASAAEVAVTVLDSCQGLGLGTVMLGVLVLRARMLGVDRLRAVTLPENDVVRRWLLDLGWSIVREDAMVEFEGSTGPPGLADQLRPSRARFDHLLEVLRPPLECCLERTRGADADRP
jgi:GNAT superfamily N-acetyltransferase